jgi:hypothetical protein
VTIRSTLAGEISCSAVVDLSFRIDIMDEDGTVTADVFGKAVEVGGAD